MRESMSLTIVVAVVCCLGTAACSSDADATGADDLLGKWDETISGAVVEFTADGKMIVLESGALIVQEIDYVVDGSTIVLASESIELPPADYSIDGDTLTITYPWGTVDTYTRAR